MRLVLDTGILVSALIREGTPPQMLYDLWEIGTYTLILSAPSIEEIERVMGYAKMRRYFTIAQGQHLLWRITNHAEIAQNLPDITLSPDPKDNHILATAIAGKADYIVSGDKKDLLVLEAVQGIRIITAREALEMLEDF